MRIQQFDYSIDFSLALLWQYDNTNNLAGLLNAKQAWYNTNQSTFWQDWYTNVFNLLTADGFGLAVWSYILNLPLYTQQAPEPEDAPIWGFNGLVLSGTLISGMNTITGLSSTAKLAIGDRIWDGNINIPYGTTIASIASGTSVTMSNNALGSATETINFSLGNTYLNFGNSNFSSKGTVIILTEEEQRFILRLRYFQLSNRGDITDINKFLNYLCTTSNINYNGSIYALDGLNMTMTYVFTGTNMSPALIEVLTSPELDLLPRPAGVGLKYLINWGKTWGFGPYNQNFQNGNFLNPFIN